MCDYIALAHATRQALGDFLQQQVAGTVAEGVVDALEVVQVEKHQRQQLIVSPRQAQQQVELLGEQPAIGESGQAVEVGQLTQPVAGFGDLAYGTAELFIALTELHGAFLDLHAEQLMVDINPALVLIEPADDGIEDRSYLLDFPAAVDGDRFLQAPGIDGVGLAGELRQGGHQSPGVPGNQQTGTQDQQGPEGRLQGGGREHREQGMRAADPELQVGRDKAAARGVGECRGELLAIHAAAGGVDGGKNWQRDVGHTLATGQ